ncbi:unannotated protein [freshwater metagenome]|uniref:Unannotated protein n=1 Tax=freshwater metagenome TaxID=449393 RepID=A0A6J7RVF5_9ZZZZ
MNQALPNEFSTSTPPKDFVAKPAAEGSYLRLGCRCAGFRLEAGILLSPTPLEKVDQRALLDRKETLAALRVAA